MIPTVAGTAQRRRLPAAGAAALTAAAVLLAPSIAPPPAAITHAARLTAAPAPLDSGALESAPSAAQALDFADAAELLVPSIAAASGIGEFLQNLYLGAEQWVRYGVNLLAWVVGWVPFAGLLAPQLNFFYDLGESILRSTVFNTIDLLTGTVGFGQALSNIGGDTTAAFHDFFTAQVNWITHFLPPAPPIFPSAEATADWDAGPVPDLAGSDPGF